MPHSHDSHGHSHNHDAHHDHHHNHHDGAGPYGGPGHNYMHSSRAPLQWQTPHQAEGKNVRSEVEPDLDKIETAFVEGFFAAPDPTSFLRLAGIPFEVAAAGLTLRLLRVEIDALTDVGSLTPHLGGESFRYDPLPAGLVSRRKRLAFVYFDGRSLRKFGFADTRSFQGSASALQR
jgi:hypothetical protein